MEIRFYHLENQTIEQALPALVLKAYTNGHRIMIKVPNEETSDKINDLLWTFRQNSFLPHGSEREGQAEHQPIWITQKAENDNKADVLVTAYETDEFETPDGITLRCEIFHGGIDDELKAARKRWKSYQDQGLNTTYWQQTEDGGWDKKAV